MGAPGTFGLATWSPKLGRLGNSLRGGSHRDERIADLLFAAGQGDATSVRKALALGIEASAADYDQRTALHIAAAEGHANCVQLLLAEGADPTLQDRWQKTPLQEATEHKHDEVVKLLQQHK